ncbi:helix-turn-helix domain-containing protein, partial [Alistipes onderdonkii]|nr:helix-turn-helix domain-containing protein [Alistipes onderdonkii]
RAYGDVRAAAEALHQHPNTVRYRLRRAKAVLDMPDAPDREFAFLLGLVFLDRTTPLLGRCRGAMARLEYRSRSVRARRRAA